MAATPYKPVVFSSESLSQAKLQQLANNQQWFFENTPRIRYAANGLIRDSGVKVVSGKSTFAATPGSALDILVYFGNFFTAGCSPNVVTAIQTTGGHLRKIATVRALTSRSAALDHTGFIAHVSAQEEPHVSNAIEAGGWMHWIAVGY